MRPHGSDRLRIAGDQLILWCRIPKTNWVPRVPKTLTTAEHPGTAVLWEDQFFEVVYSQPVANGVEYTLEPWQDVHMIRLSDRYDAVGEQHRTAAHNTELSRAKKRKATWLLGMFAGHLPTGVQEKLGNELGLMPSRLTLMSLIPGYLAFAACLFIHVDSRMKQQPDPIPLVVWMIVFLAFLDAFIRGFVALTQSRGMGSPFGFFGYLIYYYLFAKNRADLLKPLDEGRGHRLFTLPPSEDVDLQDRLILWGPALSLLSAKEQERMAAIGFDYRRHASGLAWIILLGSLLGVLVSFGKFRDYRTVSAFFSMLVASGLAIEQIFRLTAFSRGPAGSVLGFLARPFVRKLLERG